jgi:hypothetical protein
VAKNADIIVQDKNYDIGKHVTFDAKDDYNYMQDGHSTQIK